MDKIKTSEDIDYRRRHFVGTAALAAVQLGMIGVADAQSSKAKLPSVKPGSHTSFGPLKQIDAGLLNVGYAWGAPRSSHVIGSVHPYWASAPRCCHGPGLRTAALTLPDASRMKAIRV